LLVKRVFLLLNAAFAMAILDLISHVPRIALKFSKDLSLICPGGSRKQMVLGVEK
jgi:hypothetical protein